MYEEVLCQNFVPNEWKSIADFFKVKVRKKRKHCVDLIVRSV